MDCKGVLLQVLSAAVCIGLAAAGLTIQSSGGHKGDEINVYCYIKNYEGVSAFFRQLDGRNETILSQELHFKYVVFRCNKTIIGLPREDSVLSITDASESDSGTYGCVLTVNGIPNWEVSDLVNITVKPACPGAESTSPSSLTTNGKKDSKERSATKDDEEPSSQNTGLLAALIVLSIVVLAQFIALFVMSRKRCRKQVHRNKEGINVAVDLNGTQSSFLPPSGNGDITMPVTMPV